MPKITVKISKLGDSKIEVNGETGTRCVDVTAAVEAALAGTGQTREYKPEYDEVAIDQTVENS